MRAVLDDVWLAVVLAVAGVVAVVGTLLVARSVRPVRRPDPAARSSGPRAGSATRTTLPLGLTRATLPLGRGVESVLGSLGRPRAVRTVEGNLQRALDRIDAIDPYAVQQRIGDALLDAGLFTAEPAEAPAPRPGHTWPPDPVGSPPGHEVGQGFEQEEER